MTSIRATYLWTVIFVLVSSPIYAGSPDFASLAIQAEKIDANKNPRDVIALLEPYIDHIENKNINSG